MIAGLGRFLRRQKGLVTLARRLSLPDYVEPLRRRRYRAHAIQKEVGELRFQMWIDNPVSEEWYERTEVSRISEYFVDSLVGKGARVVDAGAHNGYYALLSALRVGEDGQVYAFEALPSNYRTLTKNIEMNGLRNVQAYNVAVGGRRDRVRFNCYNDGMMSAHGRLVVEMVPLAEVVDAPVDVLKIDVEGAECEVLEGARGLISPSTRIMCEVHPERLGSVGRSSMDVVDLLRSFGGTVRYWDDGALCAVDEHMESLHSRKSFLVRVPEGWSS